MRHSAAHVMAWAVQNLFGDVKFDIGPATETGFYYDFDMPHRLCPQDLKNIEKEMQRLSKKAHPFSCQTHSRESAQRLLSQGKQPYKLERLADISEDDTIRFYSCGDFVDLCRGPHVDHTGDIGVFKLLSIAGSYYRGKENNPMLQRIYGTTFSNKVEMNCYLDTLEEAKKRDHRRLGKELDLFSISDEIGPGLILWHPKGGRVRHLIENFWRQAHYQHGYELIYSPHIGDTSLWQTSGHLDFYQDAMYSPMKIDRHNYFIKPMNCPFHIKIYQSTHRSYRELPLRWAELGTVYRYEKSGVLHGLLRVRGFTQDDAHIFCTAEQIHHEINEVLQFSLAVWQAFGFKDIKAYLATRPRKAVGDPQEWNEASAALQTAIEANKLAYEIDPGGGAFYGPKIDLKIKDALKRDWQTSTIQFDFNLPRRFDLSYIGSDGKKHRPYMIHRALLGSLERFFAILIEHYNAAFPLWLAPEQVRLIPITDKQQDYVQSLKNQLQRRKLRVNVDLRRESLGARIRQARNERIPYILIAGDKELDQKLISVRERSKGELGSMTIDTFMEHILTELERQNPVETHLEIMKVWKESTA